MSADRRKTIVLVLALCVGIGAGLGVFLRPDARPKKKALATSTCDERVTKAELDRSIELGEHFMLAHQKPAGNFDYEYDWRAKKNSTEDNAARQSGALWGLGLLYLDRGDARPSPELTAGLKRGIAYFDDTSRTTKDGLRYPIYVGDTDKPAESKGGVGMAALVTLGIIEYVRGLPAGADRTQWTARANEYVSFVAGLQRPDGLWPGDYLYFNGAGTGAPSPYSDGEAMLCLVEAMKYLGRTDLASVIQRAAKEGHRVNIEEARAAKADSDTTKGYYQWSSMAYYELATSDLARTSAPGSTDAPLPYGNWLMDQADWILDVHHVLDKPRNTGYAYEGIVSAYAWATQVKDPRADKFACAIHQGLGNLMGWQVGHPRAAALGGGDDPKAAGGVQNHATEPPLRIDVVQHQMHATMLARHYLFANDVADAAR